jgi:hypothetical protein
MRPKLNNKFSESQMFKLQESEFLSKCQPVKCDIVIQAWKNFPSNVSYPFCRNFRIKHLSKNHKLCFNARMILNMKAERESKYEWKFIKIEDENTEIPSECHPADAILVKEKYIYHFFSRYFIIMIKWHSNSVTVL